MLVSIKYLQKRFSQKLKASSCAWIFQVCTGMLTQPACTPVVPSLELPTFFRPQNLSICTDKSLCLCKHIALAGHAERESISKSSHVQHSDRGCSKPVPREDFYYSSGCQGPSSHFILLVIRCRILISPFRRNLKPVLLKNYVWSSGI